MWPFADFSNCAVGDTARSVWRRILLTFQCFGKFALFSDFTHRGFFVWWFDFLSAIPVFVCFLSFMWYVSESRCAFRLVSAVLRWVTGVSTEILDQSGVVFWWLFLWVFLTVLLWLFVSLVTFLLQHSLSLCLFWQLWQFLPRLGPLLVGAAVLVPCDCLLMRDDISLNCDAGVFWGTGCWYWKYIWTNTIISATGASAFPAAESLCWSGFNIFSISTNSEVLSLITFSEFFLNVWKNSEKVSFLESYVGWFHSNLEISLKSSGKQSCWIWKILSPRVVSELVFKVCHKPISSSFRRLWR